MKNYTCEELKKDIDRISVSIIRPLEVELRNYLDKCGLFYKVFMRIKKSNSIIEKLENRRQNEVAGYKLQDLVGIRIVLYFKSDIALCEKLIQQHFSVDNKSKDDQDAEKFKAQRINYVCWLPEDVKNRFDTRVWEYPIDATFEIQIRTIFSEGWHEIEHDFRYKCLDEWDDFEDQSRTLNGILATLENCDWAISSLFEQMAYKDYKNAKWIPMLKNVFRIRITDVDDMQEILAYFDENKEAAKAFFRIDRQEFLLHLSDIKIDVPLNLKNVVCLANIYQVKDKYIQGITPKSLLRILEVE
jgi:hypothetical protein